MPETQTQYINVSIPLRFFPLVDALLAGLEGFHFQDDDEIGSLVCDALMTADPLPMIKDLSGYVQN